MIKITDIWNPKFNEFVEDVEQYHPDAWLWREQPDF